MIMIRGGILPDVVLCIAPLQGGKCLDWQIQRSRTSHSTMFATTTHMVHSSPNQARQALIGVRSVQYYFIPFVSRFPTAGRKPVRR
jgi:hypothetical protein